MERDFVTDYARAKVAALRVKLVLASLIAVAVPVLLLGLLWSSEQGRKLAEEVGWEAQAVFVFVAVAGVGVAVYAFRFLRLPPASESHPDGGSGEPNGGSTPTNTP